MVNRLIATGLLAMLSLSWLVACGTSGAGDLANPLRDESRGGTGVWAGNYEVIRYNEAGFPDPSLNGTLELALADSGGQTELTISVSDNIMTGIVALDVRYDSGRVRPEDVEFHGVMGDESQVLSASFLTQVPGVASVGQVGIHDYKPASLSGEFATLTFGPGGLRAVSAANGVHESTQGVGDIITDAPSNPVNDAVADTPNIWAVSDQVAGTATLSWSAAWHRADGNQNGIVEIADLSPLGKYLNNKINENWPAITADYNSDGIPTVADLTAMGGFLSMGTATYLVEVGDDGATSGFTQVGIFDWTLTEGDDWTAPTDPNNPAVPSPVDLGTVFKTWHVDFDNTTPFTFAQLSAIDAAGNANGTVSFHITPQRNGENGVPGSVDIGVFVDTTRYITVNNVNIRVEGASGGVGTGSDVFDNTNDEGSVVANSSLNIVVNGISGTYSSLDGGGTFSAGNYPADMTQQDYDDALAAVLGNDKITWTVANAGAPGFRYRSDWLTFNPAPPAFGDLGPGTVFPDDDPESTGANAEGRLTVSLAAATDMDGDPERSIVASNFSHTFSFDVTADPNAPVMADPFDLGKGQTATELTLLEGNQLLIDLTLATPVADPTATTLQLLEIGPGGDVLGTPVAFTYQDGATQQGQFFFRTVNPPQIQCFVSGVAINPASAYHFTFMDAGGPWSSLNTPEPLLTTVPPPPPADLLTLPSRVNLVDNIYKIKIMHPEPQIRRDGRVVIDPVEETVTPVDVVGFSDILKMSGDQFVLGADQGVQFPRITIIEGNDPSGIDATTVGLEGAALVTDRQPGHVIVDVLGVIAAYDTDTFFAYKLFNENDSAAGQGTFQFQTIPFNYGSPIAEDWGVNVFNRLNTETDVVADLPALFLASTRTTNRANNGQPTPDVLWFQFNGGYVYDHDFPINNVRAVFENLDIEWSNGYGIVDIRIAGIMPNGSYLAIHTVSEADYYSPSNPDGWFIEGSQFAIHLDDSTIPGPYESTFSGDPLTVVNNP